MPSGRGQPEGMNFVLRVMSDPIGSPLTRRTNFKHSGRGQPEGMEFVVRVMSDPIGSHPTRRTNFIPSGCPQPEGQQPEADEGLRERQRKRRVLVSSKKLATRPRFVIDDVDEAALTATSG
ncbi:hypothetical protein Ddye_028029 [Dipteronia dyeriana]|uniref:Uncharacterized protein n=1 Tax=Dipteronia dyeriana TaxID=168575 RepID=A0AAD9TR60_9ROSI|nr:hypothetical protein Ddye_028029 [Dipteronia dyeriana]